NDESESPSPYVFPRQASVRKPDRNNGHVVELKHAWKRILKRAGLDGLWIHDLRRTLGSWQAATGASLAIIGKTLAHKNVSTTAIYARLNLDPVRGAMETATNAILVAAGVVTKKNVTRFRKKAAR